MVRCKLEAGDILAGRYRILRVVGQGGMGTVYLAEDLKLPGKQWAVKETVNPQQDYQAFVDEAEMLVKLSHAQLPGIVDYFPPDQDGFSYLVMDYIEGRTLQERFQENRTLATDTAVRYALQICDLFQYLHSIKPEPIIYRDLKPGNIMVDEQDKVTLIDFGIARSFKEGKDTDTVQIGTIGFAAPEQFEQRQTDHRTDLYALGALLFYLLSEGQYYYVAQCSIGECNKRLPDALIQIIDRLLSYQPEDRYQSAAAVKADLEKLLEPRASGQTASAPRQIVGTVTIAVTGVSPGVGCTHNAITLAHYLARSGYSVALVEVNRSQAFAVIESMYEGTGQPIPNSRSFTIQGVTYYKNNGHAMPELPAGTPYNYLIFDLGCYEDHEAWFSEFNRAQVQLVVAAGIEWKQQEIRQFAERNMRLNPNKWIFCIPFVEPMVIKDIRKLVPASKVWALPAHGDPYAACKETDTVYDKLLEGYLAAAHLHRKSWLYWAAAATLVVVAGTAAFWLMAH